MMSDKLMNQRNYLPGVHCSACFDTDNSKLLKPESTHNSRSRFCDAYVCSACGTEEALKGFFWRERAVKRGFELNV